MSNVQDMESCLKGPGRKRILKTPQTHNGCFTCKSRRVRCDLGRPACTRCTKAGKVCEGYRDPPPNEASPSASSSSQSAPALIPAITDDVASGESVVLCLTHLGCEVLRRGAVRKQGAAASFWSSTIPQLGRTVSLVSASMAAFGAAINTCIAPSSSGLVLYARQCGSALRCIQQHLDNSMGSSVALFAACLLLAVSEMLIGQELSALSHLQGTLSVLQQRKQRVITSGKMNTCAEDKSDFPLEDDIDVAGAALDIGTASYALGLEPRLPQLITRTSHECDSTLDGFFLLERRILSTLHSAYSFASRHHNWKYVPNRFVPKDVFINQNGICCALFQRIQQVRLWMRNSDPQNVSRALVLRAQSSACLIYVQMLLDPHETGYDRLLSTFNSIVEDAEVVVTSYTSEEHSYFSLSLDLGVIQPLFLTATKCRDLPTRLRAIRLLSNAGREGPFDGRQMSVVARRACQLEAEPFRPLDNIEHAPNNYLVPERYRIRGVGINIQQSPEQLVIAVSASFSRCRDMEILMNAENAEEYQHPSHWEIWDERLPLPA